MTQLFHIRIFLPVVLILFLVASITGIIVATADTLREVEALQQELAAFIAPPITIDGATYEIRDGRAFRSGEEVAPRQQKKILRIARYAILNRLDPVFALEGADVSALRKSIANLEDSRYRLTSLYAGDEQRELSESFYPRSFLAALPELERLRRVLVSAPQEDTPQRYAEALLGAVDAYRSDLKRLIRTYESFSSNERARNTAFHFLGGYSTVENFLETLTVMDDMAAEKRSAAARRAACFTRPGKCPLTLETDSLKVDPPPSKPLDDLTPTMETIRDIFLAYHEGTHPGIDPEARTRPSIILNRSRCSYTGSAAYHLFWREEEENRILQLEALDDIYFFDTRRFDSVSGPYLTNLKEHGVDLLFQTQMNAYMCPDIGEEISRAGTLSAIHAALQESPLTGSSLENRIAQSKTVRESDIEQYLSALSSLLRERGERQLAEDIGTKQVVRAERLLSLHRQNSVYVPEILSHIVWTDRNAANRIRRLGGITPLEELYISRGSPLVLFLAFNRSVTDGREVSFLEHSPKNPVTLKGLHFASYLSNLRNTYTPQQISELMIENYEFKREQALPRKI